MLSNGGHNHQRVLVVEDDSQVRDVLCRVLERAGYDYPSGLAHEEIPLEGRIAAVADVFDALTSDRVYRQAFTLEDAVQTMREDRGTHFDPAILDAFLEDLEQVVAIKNHYSG
jgi:putative two-component system response regulator